MNKEVENKLSILIPLFKEHKVARAFLFGSSLSEKFNQNSDVDFLISFKAGLSPLENGELWWNLYDKLRLLFNREIDLVNESSIKNPYFKEEINKTKKLIYEQ